MKTTVLFIGGGYTTIWAYKQLSRGSMLKKIRNNELELIVLCDRKQHYFHGFTGDVIAGIIPEAAICTPLKTLIPEARFIYGSATGVAPFMKTVKYIATDGQSREIKYDHLVVGCGTVEQENERVQENVCYIKKPKGLYNFKRELNMVLEEYKRRLNEQPQGEKQNIVVLGSGFTGVEIATNLSDYISNHYTNVANICIVSSHSSILKEWQESQPSLVRYTLKLIGKKNIKLFQNCTVIESNGEGIRLSDGTFLQSQLVLSATGQKPVALQGLKHLCLDSSGKIATDSYLNAEGHKNIWCGGDIAQVKRPYRKGQCPPNALWAIMQGSRIGKNIKRSLNGKQPNRFIFPGMGQAAAFGTGQGALELYGMAFKGWLAYVIRMGFFFYFFPAKLRLLKLCWQAFAEKRGWHKNGIPATSEAVFNRYRELLIAN